MSASIALFFVSLVFQVHPNFIENENVEKKAATSQNNEDNNVERHYIDL